MCHTSILNIGLELQPSCLMMMFSICRSLHVFVSCLVFRHRTLVSSRMMYRWQMSTTINSWYDNCSIDNAERSGYAPEFRGRFFRYSAMPPVHDNTSYVRSRIKRPRRRQPQTQIQQFRSIYNVNCYKT